MAYPEKKKRNDDIMRLRELGIGLRAIARMKKLTHQTVSEIIERREKKAAGVKR